VALGVRRLTHDDVRVSARHPYLDVPLPFVMAHRGHSPAGLENSMAAFAEAVRLGVTHLETDVRATADGVLVAFHDARLDRVTGARGRVADLDWETVRRARIGGSEPIPTLEDVLGAWPDVRVNVDLKSVGAVEPFVQAVRRTRSAHRVCVASFSDRRRRDAVRALRVPSGTPAPDGAPAWSLGLGPTAAVALAARLGASGPGRRAAADLVRRALRGAVALQVPSRAGPLPVVTADLLDGVHAAGAQVHVWTVDDPGRMSELLRLGVDAIITNRSDLALPLTAAHRGAL